MDEFWSNSAKQGAVETGEHTWANWPSGALTAMRCQIQAERSRWILWLPVLLSCGISVYFSLPVEPSGWAIVSLGALALCFILGAARGALSAVMAMCLAVLLVGVCVGKVRTMTAGPGTLVLPSGIVVVEGWVERIDLRSGSRGLRLSIVPTLIELVDAPSAFPKRLSFIWRGSMKSHIEPGDHVRLRVKFLTPPGPVWPGGYDPSFVRWFKGIGGAGIVIRPPEKVATVRVKPGWVEWMAAVEGARLRVANRIRAVLSGPKGAVAVALVTGDRSGIPDLVRDDLRAAGLAHLLAISGLHMALFAGGVFWLLRALLAINAQIVLSYPIKKWAAGAALCSAAGYLLLSGAGLATQRAFIMITIMFVAIIVDRPALSMRNVALAAMAILIFRPESVLSVSFQLSFLAVIALVAMYEYVNSRSSEQSSALVANTWLKRGAKHIVSYVCGVGLTTLIAGLATAPVSAYHFNRLAVFGLLANLLAVPVVGSLVMPAAIVALVAIPFGLETWPLAVMGEGISAVIWVANQVSDLPGSVRMVSQIPLWSGLIMSFGLLWLCLWSGRWRMLGLAMMFAGCLISPVAQDLPSVIVADNAKQVAVDRGGGNLVFSSSRSGKYAAERWLLKFGDAGSFKEAVKRPGFSCDSYGCTIALSRGREISVVRHPSILEEECARAFLIITTFNFRGACPAADKLIMPRHLKRKGAHAVWLNDPGRGTAEGLVASEMLVETARSRPGGRHGRKVPGGFERSECPQKR
ncbi:MAG: ComEC family competence protein [Rhodobacteraceae bacterium]|nr:ComEC family competence protein [Paracoccaceae bacterium]